MKAHFGLVKLPYPFLSKYVKKRAPPIFGTDGAARRDKLLENKKWFREPYIRSYDSRRSNSLRAYVLYDIRSTGALLHAARGD